MTDKPPSGQGRSRGARAVSAVHRAIPFKNRIYDPIRRLTPRGIKRRLQPIRYQGLVTVNVDANHSFTIESLGTRIENDLYWRGYGLGWEGMSLQLWRHLVPSATTIFDIGASSGIYALAAKALNPQALVVAFEPLERHVQFLEANMALNTFEIMAVEKAVSDVTGSATMYDVPAQHGLTSLEVRPGLESVEVSVQTVRLDDFADEHGLASIDLIKIDIEGHEPAAIRGMGDRLSQSRPAILVEILSDDAGAEVWNLLQPLGYGAYRIADRKGVVRTDALTWVSNRERNYLLATPQKLQAAGLTELVEKGSMARARA